MSLGLTRRAALGVSGVFVALGFTQAQARIRPNVTEPGGFRVDVGPLRANGSEMTAGWVEQILPRALAQAFAAHGTGAASVTAQIDYATLGPSAGIGAGPGATPDQMSGEVTVNGVTRPLRATTYSYPTSVDLVNIEQSNFYRVRKLCEAFAYWAAAGY